MKIKSTSAAREEHVRFHTTTSSHVHHMHCESDQSFMCQTFYMWNMNCPHMAGLISKRRERASRQSPWFLLSGLTCRRSSVSLKGWTALKQNFCSAGLDGSLSSDGATAGTPSSRQPVEIWFWCSLTLPCLNSDWAICCLVQPAQLSINRPVYP